MALDMERYKYLVTSVRFDSQGGLAASQLCWGELFLLYE